MSFLQLVLLKSDEGAPLANKTKVKIILNLVAYERAMESFNEDMRGIYAKLKPEGYDAQAFPRVNELEKKENISNEEKQELESIKQSEEYLSYVEMKKTLMREFEEARECASADEEYFFTKGMRRIADIDGDGQLTDDDLVSIAEVIPSDKEFAIGRNEDGEIKINGITVLAEIGRMFIM